MRTVYPRERSQGQEYLMITRNIRLAHRIAVDWSADTFGLRAKSAQERHDEARYRAYQRHEKVHERVRELARRLPQALHQPREQRVLRAWQARIAGLAGTGSGASVRRGGRP
jgi:hypothetical protein